MKHMAGRKRHSAEDVVRKLRRADDWLPRARPVRRSPPSWACQRPRSTTGAAPTAVWVLMPPRSLRELREQNVRLKRLLAEAELEKDALWEVATGKF